MITIYVPRYIVAQSPSPYACAKAAIEAAVEGKTIEIDKNDFNRHELEIWHDFKNVPCQTYVNKATDLAFRKLAGSDSLSETARNVFKLRHEEAP